MRYLFYGIAFLFCLSACNTQVKQANKRGLEYMKQQRYEKAITEFNNILEADPLWFPAYYNRAISYANSGRNKEALRDLNYVLANYPDNADAYFNRGIVYENLGSFPNAIKDYTETLQLRPDFILAYHYRGIARFRMRDLDGALEDYNQAREWMQLRQKNMDSIPAHCTSTAVPYCRKKATCRELSKIIHKPSISTRQVHKVTSTGPLPASPSLGWKRRKPTWKSPHGWDLRKLMMCSKSILTIIEPLLL